MSDPGFGQKAICKNCLEDVSSRPGSLLLRCAECPENLDLCPDCWSNGAQIGDHLPSHAYRVLDQGGFGALNSEWTAREHLVLLDSVEQYGFGNWEDVAKKASTANPQSSSAARTPEETKEEFCNTFINQPLGRHTWKEEQRPHARDHTQPNPLLPDPQSASEPPPNLSVAESIMLGYMAKRDDFEIEFDNDAETLVSGLRNVSASRGVPAPKAASSDEDDDPDERPDDDDDEEVDVALMAAHVDMYKFRLRERERRKKVAREHQLVGQFLKENPISLNKPVPPKPSKSKKEKSGDVTERLKILAEFQGVEEHRQFMASIVKEKDVKSRLKDLTRYRKNGILSMKDSQDFELQRSRRLKRKNERRRAAAMRAASAAAAAANPSLDDSNSCSSPAVTKTEDAAASPSSSPTKTSSAEDKLLTLSALPGFDILSQTEKKLCVNLKLTPAQYTSYKTCLLVHHLQKKKGQTPKPLNPQGLDKNYRKIIFNFLMRAGWITAY